MIRRMTTEDIAHVQHIARISHHDMYNGILSKERQAHFIERTYSKAMMNMQLEKTLCLIAECEHSPVAFASFTRVDNDGDAELTALHILPAHKRCSHREQLIHAALEMLSDGLQLFAYVDQCNKDECVFFEKQGFQFLDCFNETFEGSPVKTAQYVYKMNAKKPLTI